MNLVPEQSMPSEAANHSHRKEIIVIAILLTIFVVAFAAALVVHGLNQYDAGYAAGALTERQHAKKVLEDARIIPPPDPTLTLTGTVQSKNESSLTILVAQTIQNPFDESAPLTRTVNITTDTSIKIASEIPEEEYRALVLRYRQNYIAAQEQGTPLPTPPEQTRVSTGTISDIQEGAEITVTAESDILRAATFTATTIEVKM